MKLYSLNDILESFDVASWLEGESTDMDRAIQKNVADIIGKTVIFDTEFLIPSPEKDKGFPGWPKNTRISKKICSFYVDSLNFKSVQIVDEFGNIFRETDTYTINVPSFMLKDWVDAEGKTRRQIDCYIPDYVKYFNSKSVKLKIFITFKEDSEVIDLNYTFYQCADLLNVNNVSFDFSISNLNISARNMFQDCKNLRNVRNFDMRGIVDMSYMFDECKNLQDFEEEIRIDACNELDFCFYGCKSLISPSIRQIRGGNASTYFSMISAFQACTGLKHIDLFWTEPDDVPDYIDISQAFDECPAMSDKDLSIWGMIRYEGYSDPYLREEFEGRDGGSDGLGPYLKASLA